MNIPKILIVSDGTPETTKVFLNGQQIECVDCSFGMYKPIEENDYKPQHSVSFNVTLASNNGNGESMSTTYRLYKTSKGELKFQKLVPV